MKKKVLVIGTIISLVGLAIFIKPKKEYVDITEYNNKLALYVENNEGIYEPTNTIPTSGYTLNESKSACSNNAKPSWNLSDNTLKISSLDKNSTSCYLYFRKANASDKIISNSKVNEGTPDFSKIADTDEGMFKAEDDDGTSYYYRGAVENNYIKFANKYWRIIRINGDGSIRMIYDGTSARANGSTLTVETSAFNTNYNDNAYVGFKYTVGQAQGTSTKSTILTKLETWYNSNLTNFINKLDPNSGFCGDRRRSTTNGGAPNGTGGIGTTTTYYAARYRLYSNKKPELSCETADLYTVSGASKGNKSLEKPIGLITADEVAFAGGVNSEKNLLYYLCTRQHYWTMTPFYAQGNYSSMFYVHDYGYLSDDNLGNTRAIRPVINLRSDIELTGIGTMSDPYVVVGGN